MKKTIGDFRRNYKDLQIIPVSNIDEIIQSALASELKPIEWSKEDIEAHDQSIVGSKEKARPTMALTDSVCK